MSSATATLVLVIIFAFAALLLALPSVMSRRERRRRAAETPDADLQTDAPTAPTEPEAPPPEDATEAPAAVLTERLGRSRAPFRGLRDRWRARRLDDDAWDDLEETLLLADVGVPTTGRLLDSLRSDARRAGIGDADQLPPLLAARIADELGEGTDRSLHHDAGHPNVWLLVGVNGVGKTTTAAKLAQRELDAGHRVLLVAADTFRAAAAEQLAHWGGTVGVDVTRGQPGGDPASVVFDAMQSAQARGIDTVIVDTAGRLHTKVNLMEELKKIRRIVERFPDTLGEVLLVLDASTGQNGLTQASQFTEAVGVTGVVLTKLDGTAKGGIVLAVEAELGVPVKLIGIGEHATDLVTFDPRDFAAALIG
ncbi:MAG TPA: signal recognition particle-docking protein FtsY [Acidimicrobiia bacterium]|nr:signal recognition particle-docking protein FtsY [Acidimicrobiia bacterium]